MRHSGWRWGRNRPRNALPATLPPPSASPGGGWQKQHPRERSRGFSKPATHPRAAIRKGGGVQGGELGNPPARCRRVADDKKPRDTAAGPTAFASDLGSKSSLAIEPVQRRLRVRHDRLHLDDEHDSCQSMEGQDVDRAALAPDRERDLDGHLPAGRTKEKHRRIDEPSVRLIEQSVECLPIPSKADVDGGTNRRRDRPERSDRD